MGGVKIILREDLASLGKAGDVVTVAPGYARNFLLPRGLAAEATPGNLKQLELKKQVLARKEEELKKEAEAQAGVLEGQTVKIPAKVGRDGRLYGSITAKDIAEAIAEQKKIVVDKKKIVLEEAIKVMGTHSIAVRLHPDVEARVNLEIAEGEKSDEGGGKTKEK
ncbi:MAG: 50S ribosomal protein L9 [Actinomycetota bacterium]|nr:50S ribosomal protein L9 [Actinomycetota bacterium]